jgi:hypothetical protein
MVHELGTCRIQESGIQDVITELKMALKHFVKFFAKIAN